ncbi:MAG TPA: class I SAM-dependent methyltransferase [Ktedonobacteraceae bacterium]
MMPTAIERWKAIIDARAQQTDAAFARLGRTSADFWDRRARGFHHSTKDTTPGDPFFQHLCQAVTAQTTVLDVGAGTGRLSIALAPLVKHIIAVEPNDPMRSYLSQEVERREISNISCVTTTWELAPADLQADVIICSHVLYGIRDVDTFIDRLYAATRQACYIYMRAKHFDAINAPLWKHFHGEDRCLPPGYIHALDVMFDMGMYADVDIVHYAQHMRFSTLDVAVEEMLEQLILPDDAQTRAELRALLSSWLAERDGALALPANEMTAAIMRVLPG